MVSVPEDQLEDAVERAIRKALDHGRTEVIARSLAAFAMEDDNVSIPVTPRDVGKYLHENRDLGFVEVEKQESEIAGSLWVLHETDE